jgi:hypothetical protein
MTKKKGFIIAQPITEQCITYWRSHQQGYEDPPQFGGFLPDNYSFGRGMSVMGKGGSETNTRGIDCKRLLAYYAY